MDTNTENRVVSGHLLKLLTILFLVTTACGASAPPKSSNPFHREPEPKRERDWPRDSQSADGDEDDDEGNDEGASEDDQDDNGDDDGDSDYSDDDDDLGTGDYDDDSWGDDDDDYE